MSGQGIAGVSDHDSYTFFVACEPIKSSRTERNLGAMLVQIAPLIEGQSAI
jgi:hypothetical protein